MPSTFSQSLRIELIGSGEQSGVWGVTTNNNLGSLIEQAISGNTPLDVTLGDITLTALNGVVDQSRSAVLTVSGTPGTTRVLTIPNVTKLYTIRNTSDSPVQIKTATGSPYTVPVAAQANIFCDGLNVITGRTITDGANTILSQALPFNSPAFTGVPTAPTAAQGTNTTQIATTAFVNAEIASDTANLAPLNSPALTGTPTAPTAAVGTNTTQLATTAFVNAEIANDAMLLSGNQTVAGTKTFTSTIVGSVSGSAVSAVTQPVGTNNTTIATTAFVQNTLPSGVIVMWSGSIASIPSGWALCNGASGTPDLRDRFIVGAGGSYAVGATGGATTTTLSVANLPSHTHTGTTNSTSIAHTHTFSATTGTESVPHTHGGSGTTSSTNISHTHAFTATTGIESATHTHGGSGTTSSTSIAHTHTFSATSGEAGGHDHTGSGTTSSTNVDHTHSGTTSNQSVDHTHSGTTASENQNHTHGYSGTTSGVGDHTHAYDRTYRGSGFDVEDGNSFVLFESATSTGGAGAHSHTFGGNTGGISNNHQHAFTTGGVSTGHTHTVTTGGMSANAAHTHTYSFTTSAVLNHTHSVSGTTGSTDPAHTHTYSFTTGGQSVNHTHTVSGTTAATDPVHSHTYSFTTGNQSVNHTHSVSGTTGSTDPAHTHTFTTDATGSGTAFSILPPYYALAYIMKT